MVAAVAAFDLVVLIGTVLRWRYVWLAAAGLFGLAVLLFFYGPFGV
jgi:hypothetical protein